MFQVGEIVQFKTYGLALVVAHDHHSMAEYKLERFSPIRFFYYSDRESLKKVKVTNKILVECVLNYIRHA